MKIIGGLKPLLGVGIQASQMPAPEFKSRGIAKHSHHGRVCVLHDSQGVAAANAIRRVHHQRAKVALGEAQAFLRGAEGGIEPADQQCYGEEESEVRDRFAIIDRSLPSDQRIVDADGERKEVAARPGFHPPYQALTMTATAKTTRRLSARSEKNKAGIKARTALRSATP